MQQFDPAKRYPVRLGQTQHVALDWRIRPEVIDATRRGALSHDGTDLRAEFHTQAGETVALRGATVASGSQMALRFDAANQCFWLEPIAETYQLKARERGASAGSLLTALPPLARPLEAPGVAALEIMLDDGESSSSSSGSGSESESESSSSASESGSDSDLKDFKV